MVPSPLNPDTEIYGEQYFTSMVIFNEIKIQFQIKKSL